MLAPLIPPADHDGDDASFPSTPGVGERLSIRIDTPRERPTPSVAAGEGAASNAAAIHIMIRHLGPAVDVSTPSAHPVGHLGRRSSPRNGRGGATYRSDGDSNSSSSRNGCRGAISRSDGARSSSSSRNGRGGAISRSDGDSSSSSSDVEGDHQTPDEKPRTLQDELQGIFYILVLVTGALVPIALLAYALLPEDNPSAQRVAWITIGIVVGLAVIGAVISRLAVTETAAEVSSSIGFMCTVVLIIVSEIVLAKCLPYDLWSFFWGDRYLHLLADR